MEKVMLWEKVMLRRIRFFCIDERGYIVYKKEIESKELSIEIMSYLLEILDKLGFDTSLFTVMVEVSTDIKEKTSVVGHYLIGNGRIIPVDVGCARLSREVFPLSV